MSAGKERKLRSSKMQGWEEAGEEFYQESYPADWEGFQRDPASISTLLPSKQNRSATTRKARASQQDTKGTRRCQQNTATRRTTKTGQGSQNLDVQVSMLPDLSQDLTDEERIWEEINEIKSMPVPMSKKKDLKTQLQNSTKLRLQGYDQFKWQRRKAWQRLQSKWIEFIAKMELWRNSLKIIEGNFGTGVVAYFHFLRWLMFLNLAIFLLILSFIVIPNITLLEPLDEICDQNKSNSTQCCRELYLNSTTNQFGILDLIQGTGYMENTILFYGSYTNKIFGYHPFKDTYISPQLSDDNDYNHSLAIKLEDNHSKFHYDLPLAYISITAVYFLISLVAIVKRALREFKDRLIDGEGQFYQYGNLIFGGWDFCIHNDKSADIKQKALYNEIKCLLYSKRLEYERYNRSNDYMCKLIIIRLVVNIAVFIILILSALFIYFLFNISLKYLEQGVLSDSTTLVKESNISFMSGVSKISNQKIFVSLFYEFLPYVAIVCLNLIVPILFQYLCVFEKYSPMFVVKISLFRTIFLRLASLAVLLSRFYFLIIPKPDCHCCNKNSQTPQCWETFVGQQFYKLVITDFVTHLFITFFINFPRSIIARHIRTKFTLLIGEQEFELPKHILDIVYSQTLCWIGSFYSPFLPAIATVVTFFMFYIKKFQCLVNSKPSTILYRASRSNSLFMFILLVCYVVALVPVVYAIAEIKPSRSCGPFRGLNSVWETAISAFIKMPEFLQNCIFFLGTAGFAIPCFIALNLFLYYYYAVSDANKHMVEVLKNQLVLEGHDKQFLLNRLSSFLRQQQQYQKNMRQISHRDQQQLTTHNQLHENRSRERNRVGSNND